MISKKAVEAVIRTAALPQLLSDYTRGLIAKALASVCRGRGRSWHGDF